MPSSVGIENSTTLSELVTVCGTVSILFPLSHRFPTLGSEIMRMLIIGGGCEGGGGALGGGGGLICVTQQLLQLQLMASSSWQVKMP